VRQWLRTERSHTLIRALLILSLGGGLGAGCAVTPQGRSTLPQNTTTSPVVTQINSALAAASLQAPPSKTDYRLGADDLLEITQFNIPESGAKATPRTVQVRVSQEGKIALPLLGELAVEGLTVAALEQSLRERYNEYLYNPQVGVQIKEYRSQPIAVLGAVRTPNVFQLTGPKTLADLLAMAGGITERAGSQIHVYRQQSEGRHTYVIDLLALSNNPGLVNMPVNAGDVINIPEAGMFFVDGAVGRPGSYPLSRPYTLTQALAVAGGVTEALADYSSVAIMRRQNAPEGERVSVNLKEILAGHATDPQIEVDDVVVVPTSTAKYILERFIGTIGLPGFPSPIK
jgi:polysaccharide export outer membrane protein